MPDTPISFPANKVQQCVVHFAHRIPARKPLSTGEKKTLEGVLRELDPEIFQLVDESAAQSTGSLFQILCQHPINATQITLPSFIFLPDSFSFIHPVKIMGQYISGLNSLDTTSRNRNMKDWSLRVLNTLANLRCQRTGKIYEFVLGPFQPDQKREIFKPLFSEEMRFSETGEMNLTFAHYRQIDTLMANIQTAVTYVQQKLENNFLINVRVDINNRQLKQSMEPPQIEEVWNIADKIIGEHLAGTLNIV